MFLNVGSKPFGWLAVLALYPVIGLGQMIFVHPKDQTVCAGESAEFTSEMDDGFTGWYVNDTRLQDLSSKLSDFIPRPKDENTVNGTTIETLVINYHEAFNGLKVQSTVVDLAPGGLFSTKNSTAAYLFYETNQQSPATGLTHTINDMVAQFEWDEPGANQTTRFFFGVYDGNNNQITSQTTNATQISYSLPPRADDTCQYLEFRVTGIEVQYPECPDIEPSRYSAYLHIKPDIAPVTTEFDNKTVLVNWTPDSGSLFRIVVTDLESGKQSTYNGTSPFSYTPTTCGQFNLNVSVSPDQCADNPVFIHSDTIRFTINCPTTATETTEIEDTDQPSGTQASYPSLLLAIAAIIPLLKWQH